MCTYTHILNRARKKKTEKEESEWCLTFLFSFRFERAYVSRDKYIAIISGDSIQCYMKTARQVHTYIRAFSSNLFRRKSWKNHTKAHIFLFCRRRLFAIELKNCMQIEQLPPSNINEEQKQILIDKKTAPEKNLDSWQFLQENLSMWTTSFSLRSLLISCMYYVESLQNLSFPFPVPSFDWFRDNHLGVCVHTTTGSAPDGLLFIAVFPLLICLL